MFLVKCPEANSSIEHPAQVEALESFQVLTTTMRNVAIALFLAAAALLAASSSNDEPKVKAAVGARKLVSLEQAAGEGADDDAQG